MYTYIYIYTCTTFIYIPLKPANNFYSYHIRKSNQRTYPVEMEYETLHVIGGMLSVLRLRSTGGIKHSIRAICQQILKTPILGDPKYGGKDTIPDGLKDMIGSSPRLWCVTYMCV